MANIPFTLMEVLGIHKHGNSVIARYAARQVINIIENATYLAIETDRATMVIKFMYAAYHEARQMLHKT